MPDITLHTETLGEKLRRLQLDEHMNRTSWCKLSISDPGQAASVLEQVHYVVRAIEEPRRTTRYVAMPEETALAYDDILEELAATEAALIARGLEVEKAEGEAREYAAERVA